MADTFQLQDPGEGVHEAEILEVRVRDGASVSEGDDLFVVETDKAAVEIPSPFTGTVDEVHVSEGDKVKVGDVLVTYSKNSREADSDADDSADQGEHTTEEREEKAGENDRDTDGEATGQQDDTARSKHAGHEEEAGKKSADSHDEPGTRRRKSGDGETAKRAGGHSAAAPATRKLSADLDVDIEEIEGSGPGGRVEPDDVRAAADDVRTRQSKTRLPDFSKWGDTETTELQGIRRQTAENTLRSWQSIPHVMHGDRFDIGRLDELRREHKIDVEEKNGKLTILVFTLKAVAAALREFPRFNASLDAERGRLIFKRYCHIGIAVDTNEGLLVPVVRNVDEKSLSKLAVEVVELAENARDGSLEPDNMRGGSITITNPGAIGGSTFTPIINYPEVAIVGIGAAHHEPVAVNEGREVANRLMLPVIISFDHRVNDGADAARFTARIGALLSSPDELLLEA